MIKNIKLNNFRIFESNIFTTNNKLVIFSGKNATGKTSILEAIYLCSTSKSHRTNELDNLILENKEFGSCEIESEKNIKMIFSKEGKTLFINKKQIKKISDFIGNLKIVMFSPYDLNIILGSKGDRRRFLDLEVSLLDKVYLNASTAYKKTLKERNELLKNDNLDKIYLNIVTDNLINNLKVIYEKRNKFINDLNSILNVITTRLGVEKIRLEYVKTYDEDIHKTFKNKEKIDFITKTTNVGVHRDDFKILINEKMANEFASEGQIRTICICLKLAVKEYVKRVTGDEPILLLDDVFAALDKTRIRSLTDYVNESKQTFITTTSILEIPDELLKNALVLRIDNKKEN